MNIPFTQKLTNLNIEYKENSSVIEKTTNNNIEKETKEEEKIMIEAVTLACVDIYIYREFYKTNTVKQELHSKLKECSYKCCKPICDISPKSSTYRKANVRI